MRCRTHDPADLFRCEKTKELRLRALEPIVKLQVTAPNDCIGDLAGDLSGRRGRISGNTAQPGGRVAIHGEVPLAELDNYQSRVKSLTGGEGSYSMQISHYERVPPQKQRALISEFNPGDDSD